MLCTAPEAELGRVTGRPEGYRRASFRVRLQPEQVELAGETRRHRQIEMAVGDLGQHAAARGALQEALLQQIGLDDLFEDVALIAERRCHRLDVLDRKSTRLNSSHMSISYAVFCLKK